MNLGVSFRAGLHGNLSLPTFPTVASSSSSADGTIVFAVLIVLYMLISEEDGICGYFVNENVVTFFSFRYYNPKNCVRILFLFRKSTPKRKNSRIAKLRFLELFSRMDGFHPIFQDSDTNFFSS